jgi:hypothetical protein
MSQQRSTMRKRGSKFVQHRNNFIIFKGIHLSLISLILLNKHKEKPLTNTLKNAKKFKNIFSKIHDKGRQGHAKGKREKAGKEKIYQAGLNQT